LEKRNKANPLFPNLLPKKGKLMKINPDPLAFKDDGRNGEGSHHLGGHGSGMFMKPPAPAYGRP